MWLRRLCSIGCRTISHPLKFPGYGEDQFFEEVALPHSQGGLRRSTGVGRRGDRSCACHARRVGAAYDSPKCQCTLNLTGHHDNGRDLNRDRLLTFVAIVTRSLFESRLPRSDKSSSFTRHHKLIFIVRPILSRGSATNEIVQYSRCFAANRTEVRANS
jgi:hypothetical protein